jgi:hypothetical protein
MDFRNETGAIIAEDGSLISIFRGEPGHVEFPDELIAKIHKMNPGYINRFTHTHPPGMSKPSQQDDIMMSNLAVVMYPFPVRLGVIVPGISAPTTMAKMNEGHGEPRFVENVYQWVFEPREIWEARKKIQSDTKRTIAKYRVDSLGFIYRPERKCWQDWIVEESYHE